MGRRALVAAVICLVACGGKDAPRANSARAAPATSSAVVPVATGPTCARTGHWTECQVQIRLDQSGLSPQKTAKAFEVPTFAPAPIVVLIGASGLAMYIFPDTMARHRAAAALDTLHFIPQNKAVGIRGEATVIQNDNLLALLYSKNDHQRERVADAISAGPFQP